MLDQMTDAETDPTAEITAHLDAEDKRDSVPEGYPDLPDLPLGRYTDPGYFAAELAQVLSTSWLFVGHESDVPEEGSYFVADIPFAPVLLVRGRNGEIRALLNACRHRGAPVVSDCAGKVRRTLVCGFHAWTYDLAGKLVCVTEQRDFQNLNKEERSLTPLRCEKWGLSLRQLSTRTRSRCWTGSDRWPRGSLTSWPPPGQRLAHKSEVVVSCNWKVAVEAFLEAYHVKIIHARSAAEYVEPRRPSIDLYPRGHSSTYVQRKRQLSGDSANQPHRHLSRLTDNGVLHRAPIGIFRAVERPTYDDQARDQVTQSKWTARS